MIGRNPNRKPTERDLAALADGSLSGSRRARVERAVAASTELQADIASQRRALHAIGQAAAERAPGALRARLELARDPRHRRSFGWPAWASATAAVAALAVAAVLALGGPSTSPTVAAAATLATRAPAMPAGAARPNSTTLAWPYAAGLPFPDWARRFGFTAVGSRIDRLSGRVATTVFYARSGSLIAYTIVSGRPLSSGTQTRAWTWQGTRLWSFRSHGRVVVTWLRSGHTCVLSGNPALVSELLRLAASTTYYGA